MKWLKAVMVFAFVGVFALATNHCRLEIIKGFEFLVCCSHDGETESASPHQDDDCETDGCATLEGGLYKSEDGRITTPAPMAVAANDAELSTFNFQLSTFNCSAEPGLRVNWRFLLRVASQPRAPSLAS